MHIWKPICESGDPTGFAPDLNMIGSGPWRLKEYVPNIYILMVANKPGSTVTTNIDGALGTPVTSPQGYYQIMPWEALSYISEPIELTGRHKILPGLNVTLTNDFENLFAVTLMNGTEVYSNLTLNGILQYEDTTIMDLQARQGVDVDISGSAWASGKVGKDFWWHRVKDHYLPYVGLYIYSDYEMGVHIWGKFKAGGTIVIWATKDGSRVKKLFETTVSANKDFDFNKVITAPFPGRYGQLCQKNHIDPGVLLWFTIKEDIAGSTYYDDLGLPDYPYKNELPTPDEGVDMLNDIRRAAKAFGSYPGHERWDTVADINGDYSIDILNDIRSIAKKFGWVG
jgi:hypothetical protein